MPLANTLNTNEVKGRTAAEVEFELLSIVGRTKTYKYITEPPGKPVRLSISHQEAGDGLNKRRRSVIRVDNTSTGEVDTTVTIRSSAYIVVDLPIGNQNNTNASAETIAMLTSFVSTLGTSTFLYDGTGTGAAALLSGGL